MKDTKSSKRNKRSIVSCFAYILVLFSLFSTASLAQSSGFDIPVVLGDEGLQNVFDIQVHDIDDDGDQDVIAFGSFRITWFPNLGDGTFGEFKTIAKSETTIIDAEAGDLDADSDIDVIWLTITASGVHYSLNDGRGEFSGITDVSVYGSAATSLSLEYDTNEKPKALVKATYGAYVLKEIAGFPNEVVTETLVIQGGGPVYIRDLNLDGKDDYLVVTGNATNGTPELVNVALSDGEGSFTFTELNAIEREGSNYNEAVGGLLVKSKEVDEAPEIIVSTYYQMNWANMKDSGYLYHYKNNEAQFDITIIDSLDIGFEDIQLLDVDGDGIEDLIAKTYSNAGYLPHSTNQQKLFWYKGSEDGAFGERKDLRSFNYYFTRLLTGDIDNDGIEDLVSLSMDETRIEWYKKNSEGSFNNPIKIADSPIANTRLVKVEDVTGDGNKDIVLGASTKGKGLTWLKGEGGFSFSNQGVIDSLLSDVLQVEIQDVNKDGKKDIIALSSHTYREFGDISFKNSYRLGWYQNEGSEFSGDFQVITESEYHQENKYYPQSFLIYDIDGDGAEDIYLNMGYRTDLYKGDGNGSFGSGSTVESTLIQHNQYLADVDGNGSQEILSLTSQIDSTDVGADRPIPIWDYYNNYRAVALDLQLTDTLSLIPLPKGEVGGYLRSNIQPMNLDFTNLNPDQRIDITGVTAKPEIEGSISYSQLQELFWIQQGDSLSEWSYAKIDSSRVNYNDIDVADLDQDGDMDLVVNQDDVRLLQNNLEAGYQFGTLRWYENAGDGSFMKRAPIDSLRKSLQQIVTTDLDGDSKPEIIVPARDEQRLLIYKNILMPSVSNEFENEIARNFKLYQNYPNPFNPTTFIQYEVPATAKVTLRVYNILGQLVQTLIDRRQPSGIHHVRFDAGNLSSGVYIYQLSTQGVTDTKKMLIIK